MELIASFLRHTKTLTLLVSLFFLIFLEANAQFWNESDENYLYKKEFVYGINFNTNGGLIGGANFKYARVINERMYHSFFLEFVAVRDPKEERVTSFISGNNFVPGKQIKTVETLKRKQESS